MQAKWLCWLAVVAACALVAGQTAHAGGTNVAIAATANRVWVTTGSRVVELDATTGRVLFRVATRYPYPLGLALSDGNVWASSVANGFVSGAVSRIPFDAPRASTPLVLRDRPVYDLAVSPEATWALVGPRRDLRLVRIDHATRKVARIAIRHDIAWLAGDYSGRLPGLVAVTRSGGLVRIDDRGQVRPLTAVGAIAPVAVAGGTISALGRSSLVLVDERTGRVLGRRAITRPLSVTTAGGFVWVTASRPGSLRLLKIDRRGLRVVGRATFPLRSGVMAFGNGKLWLAAAVARVTVFEIDPRTLDARIFATLPCTAVSARPPHC